MTLQGENYTAILYLFLVIYPLDHEETSEKFERQFQCFFSNSARQLEVPLSYLLLAVGGVCFHDRSPDHLYM